MVQLLNEYEKLGIPLEHYIPCEQTKYYEIASQCHIAPHFWSQGELSLGAREQVYMGMALLVPKARIWDEILGKEYPFKFKDMKDMTHMFRYLVDNFWSSEVQQAIDFTRNSIKERYDAPTTADRFYHYVKGLYQSELDTNREFSGKGKFIRELFEANNFDPKQITYSELREYIKKNTDTKDIEVIYPPAGKYIYHSAMLYLGYKDIGIEEPIYVK